MNFERALLEVATFHLEAGHLFGAGGDVMRLVENDYRVTVIDFEVFANFFIDKIIVWHENEVSAGHSIFGCVVRAVLPFLCEFVNFLDVHGLPGHSCPPTLTILVVGARVNALLCCLTGRVQCEAFVHVNLRIYA